MHLIFIAVDIILLAVLAWFFIQNIRLNHALKEKNLQLEATIVELKDAHVKLMDSGKKGAVAALSAGLLHQISQPITAIHGFVRFMKKEMDINSPFYKPVCVMDEQSFYIKDMLANLMELIRHRKIQKTQTSINAVIYKSINLLLDELRIRRIGWDMQLDDSIPSIFGDALHLQQVFMNLVVNAMEALSETPHGAARTLLVTSKYDLENNQAVIVFRDNGPGIAHEHQAKIFDPFFSTKPQGSGIGLALCQDLVNEHAGTIRVDSNNEGTIFTVKLPCVRWRILLRRHHMKHLNILVVDDKKVIGDFFNLTMGYYGHHITVVHDLPHTLEAIKNQEFDIAFMDMMMPDHDGVEILKEVKAISPGLAVVMMSGYSLDEKRRQAALLGAVDCLKKPFEVDDIRRVVKEAIGQEI